MLERLALLYQLPNWKEENSVILGEWIFDNYKYDSLDDVIACLANPPTTYNERGEVENNWRLTPDRIQKWMAVQLEKAAEKREGEHNKLKSSNTEPIEGVDYEAFKKRIEETGLPKTKRGFQDEDYKRYRDEYVMKPKQNDTTTGQENQLREEHTNVEPGNSNTETKT